ncbi:adenosylcobinamide-phosphate synthase CbiB [Bermanella sp. WJH001]|uniref:adenosylcobinamide-phosphate synthase CbiB n=1 Tax=Bermanella sp. WJH001 TaxID=3048005 RepID=UPI0024BEE29B|nr:adenosylcobinamide-phosphate synthase CbiB [Bermanella sp. WJH001]MDJ1539137.1 adenosylcobinamide-phosphate synthase CbiB [Bermanella sp. WJH001]
MPFLVESTLIVIAALVMDCVLGEVKRHHPLILFGNFALRCEAVFYPKKDTGNQTMLMRGALCWCVSVLIPSGVLFAVYFISPKFLQIPFTVVVVYFAIGARSLAEHGQAVAAGLMHQDIEDAQQQLSRIVSRDTQDLNETQISSATVETITENTHDAVIAPIFWFLVFGVAGVIVFRLANTLDAMWGYKNKRYEYFGKFSARIDDVLGWPSARLTVLLFVCVSVFKRPVSGLGQIYTWAKRWYSPNAGPVMAAGAYVLNVCLGGPVPYHGVLKSRPWLGDSVTAQPPRAEHIKHAIHLMYQSTYAFVFILLIVGAIQWLY